MALLQNGQIGLDQSMCQAFSQRVMKVLNLTNTYYLGFQ